MRLITLLVIALLASRDAAAGGWQMNASTCVLDSPYSQGLFIDSPSSIGFVAGATGIITLYCPISVPNGLAPTQLRLEYIDTNGTGGNFVRAKFEAMDKSSGVITDIATVNSQTCGTGTSVCTTTFSYTMAQSYYFYYVEVVLSKPSASATEEFHTARLQ